MNQTLIVKNLTEADMRRLVKAKERDEFADRDWSEWLRFKVKDVTLDDTWHESLQQATKVNLAEIWMVNFAQNLPDIISPDGLSISDLLSEEIKSEPLHEYTRCPKCPHGSAIVVGAGPSIWKFNHLEMLAKSEYKGRVIATDRMLIPLLKVGVVPDLVLSVDGNREKIVPFYDDPLVDQYGPEIKVALCSTVAHNVAERLAKARAKVFWFNATFDDYRNIESFTRLQKMMTSNDRMPKGLPSVAALGCGGSCCWVFAHALYRASPIGLVGCDYGYHEDTPIEETAYFKQMLPEAEKAYGIKAVDWLRANAFTEVFNPHTERKAVLDLVFRHYREGLLASVADLPKYIQTYNCTGDGSMFGPGIHWTSFENFLRENES